MNIFRIHRIFMQNVNILFLSRRNPDGWRILYPFNLYLNIKNIFYYFRWSSWFKWQQHQKFETLCSSRPTKNWKNKEEQVYPGRSWGSYSLRGREITSNRDQEKTRRRTKNYECVARNQQRDNWRICTYFGEYIYFLDFCTSYIPKY